MTIRALSADEFYRLKTVADGFTPNPDSSIALVAEENGEIVARMMLVCLTHVEGTWVREDKRGTVLAYRMMKRTIAEAQKAGLTSLMAYTHDAEPRVSEYMEWLGFKKLPVLVWAKGI